MDSLLAAAAKRGVALRPGFSVASLIEEGDRCAGVLAANGEKIEAKHVIIAAGCFSAEIAAAAGKRIPVIPTRPVRGQMLALRQNNVTLRHVLRSERGYLVPRSDGRIVAGSTSEDAGFHKGVTAGGMRKIVEAGLELCAGLDAAEILETWSGLRPGTPDDLPILGLTNVEGLILATGHYRNGILLAPVTAKLVKEWVIGGRTTLDTQAFSPFRFESAERKSARC
jgi:glycine oxidase